MSIRSHPGPQPSARNGPAIDPDRAKRCTEAVRDIAEDLIVVADAFLNRASDNAAPTTELLHIVTTINALAQEATEALVVRQRSQGEPLSDLAPELKVTEDRLRKKYDPQAIDQALARRSRPMRAPLASPRLDDLPTTKALLRQPHQRLACGLTRMWKQSGVSQRALAQVMTVDPSYVSRMLSGERVVTLQHVKVIAGQCGGNLDLVKPLWEAANGVQATIDPARALRSYLRALHYAAGSPSDTRIINSVQRTISKTELRQAFDGPGTPGWPVVQQLTIAFQSLPEITRPLWRRAQCADDNTSTISAGAFG
ncbi:helix-turn-helix domain-containing protein [Streptomyces sp. NPDC057900]|uniref:helix-turn-helix domain-containing protein n=1 Tax=Streptomyces sp. NPDC057900 TaxID=3346274 RepID=UPI0036E03527